MRIKTNGEYRDIDLGQMNAPELLALKVELETDLDNIKYQLETAEAETAASGIYADSNWYHAAKLAQRRKGRQVQQIQLELKNRRENRPKVRGIPDAFMDIAREMLMPELFNEIFDEAKLRYEGRYQ